MSSRWFSECSVYCTIARTRTGRASSECGRDEQAGRECQVVGREVADVVGVEGSERPDAPEKRVRRDRHPGAEHELDHAEGQEPGTQLRLDALGCSRAGGGRARLGHRQRAHERRRRDVHVVAEGPRGGRRRARAAAKSDMAGLGVSWPIIRWA